MTDSAHDVILKNCLVLLLDAIVCVKTLHAHAVNCIAVGRPWSALQRSWAWPRGHSYPARDLQYSTELTIAIGSSNVANRICFGVGMERISPASVGEWIPLSIMFDTSSSWSSYSVLMCSKGWAGLQFSAGVGSGLTWFKVILVAAVVVAIWLWLHVTKAPAAGTVLHVSDEYRISFAGWGVSKRKQNSQLKDRQTFTLPVHQRGVSWTNKFTGSFATDFSEFLGALWENPTGLFQNIRVLSSG